MLLTNLVHLRCLATEFEQVGLFLVGPLKQPSCRCSLDVLQGTSEFLGWKNQAPFAEGCSVVCSQEVLKRSCSIVVLGFSLHPPSFWSQLRHMWGFIFCLVGFDNCSVY